MASILLALIYLAFISLGLPDAILGSAWPLISVEFGVPLANMGIVTVIIALGTIIASLNSNRLIHSMGVRRITVMSVAVTAIAMLGFSFSSTFLTICLWAVPYGLGAGCVDAALNNYAAVHFESRHVSWLHCMWGVGASLGPYIMGATLTGGHSWNVGYLILFGIQAVVAVVLFLSKPVWRVAGKDGIEEQERGANPLKFSEIFAIPGVKEIMVTFFCFCAIENTAGAWASSYLVLSRGIAPELAASFTALFYLGITVGRAISGFVSIRFSDTQMIRFGEGIMAVGVAVICLPFGAVPALVGIAIVGFGSAPVYPCIIHSTPANFGVINSQAITGVQMASAYTGVLIMPPVFGLIASHIHVGWYPIFIGVLLAVMIVMYERMLKRVKRNPFTAM